MQTGSINARGNTRIYSTNTSNGENNFASNGSGNWYNTGTSGKVLTIGLKNLTELNSLPNLKFTKLSVTATSGRAGTYSSAASKSKTNFRIVTSADSSGNYTSIGDVNTLTSGNVAVGSHTVTFTSGTIINWMNNNKSKVIAGGSNFAIRFYGVYFKYTSYAISIDYEYGAPATGVMVSPKTIKIYTDEPVPTNLLNFSGWSMALATSGKLVKQKYGFAITSGVNDCYTNTSPNITVTPGKTYTVAADVEMDSGTSAEVFIFWNGSVATLVNASISSAGTLKLTATAPSDATFCTIRFDNNTANKTIVYSNPRFYEGSDANLKGTESGFVAQVLPLDASNTNVTSTSSDVNKAAIYTNNRVIFNTYGKATITAKTEDGGYTDTVVYNIIRKLMALTLSETEHSLKPTETFTLTATPSAGFEKKSIKWSSSDTSIATISNGIVTAVAPGTCTISCKYTDTYSHSKTAKCTVTVLNPAIKRIWIGGEQVKHIFIGPEEVKHIWIGADEVWKI